MRRLIVALALALATAGCGTSDGPGVTVAAAASLTEALEALGGATFSFAGSQQLVAQVCLLYTSPSPRDRG